jgi:hypothetical protein
LRLQSKANKGIKQPTLDRGHRREKKRKEKNYKQKEYFAQ